MCLEGFLIVTRKDIVRVSDLIVQAVKVLSSGVATSLEQLMTMIKKL